MGFRLLVTVTPMSLSSSVTINSSPFILSGVLGADVHDLALLGVECHPPSFCPPAQLSQHVLQLLLVLSVYDDLPNLSVVSEFLYHVYFLHRQVQVIDEDEKEKRPQHAALWHSG